MQNGLPPVDTDLLTTALVHLEQAVHRQGWDQPASLYVLFRRDGRDDQIFHRTLPGLLPSPPGDALQVFAARLHDAVQIGHPDLKVLADPETTAVALCDEVWANNNFTSEQERVNDPRSLADIPGSYEARLLASYDVSGNQYLVRRCRGTPPDTHLRRPGDAHRFGGRVYDGLTAVVGSLTQLIDPATTVEHELLPWAGRSRG